jgi:hypothetical protein
LCKNNYYYALLIEPAPIPTSTFPHQHTGITDSGSSSFYFSRGTSVANYNPRAPTVSITVANGCPEHSVASATLASVPALPPSMMSGYVMPSFPRTIIGLGPFADQGCKIVFDKTSVTVYHPNGHPILNGWQDINGPQLWQFSLTTPPPLPVHLPPLAPLAGGLSAAMAAGLPHPSQGFRATSAAREDIQVEFLREATHSMAMAAHASSTPYNPQTPDLPSIGALVSFYHACLGFPVKQMWFDAIKAGNCNTFDGLTYSNVARYFPNTNKTFLGHFAQQRQNVRSTKPKHPTPLSPMTLPTTAPSPEGVPSNEVFIKVYPISRLYTDDTGRFPIRACSGNQYIMIAFHADGNLILQQAFKSKSDRHRIAAYNDIITRLAARGLSVDRQILNNKASAEYKEAITFKWNAKFQLVPPDMHHQNWAERAIGSFKDHFLAILASVDSAFSPYLWDPLLPQAELTLNHLHQATLNPRISAWEIFQGPFDLKKMPFCLVGCCILIHANLVTRGSWDFQAKPGFHIGPALNSYRYFKLVNSTPKSKSSWIPSKFCQLYLSVPVPLAKDKIIHGLQVVAGAIRGAPPPTSVSQLKAITSLQKIFESWHALAPPSLCPTHRLAPSPPRVNLHKFPRVVVTSPPSTSPTWSPSTALRPPPQPAAISLTPVASAPTFHVTPRWLVFGDDHSPRVVSASQQPLLPPAAPVLPVQEPTAHRTRSRVPAALALFTSGGRFHEWVQYRIPMAKSLRASSVAMGFVGLCAIHHMTMAETSNFAALCSALLHKDNPLALSVLDLQPAIC